MYYCERCGNSYNSVRATYLTDCPRCLLRSDIASPLVQLDRPPATRPERPRVHLRQAGRPVSPRA